MSIVIIIRLSAILETTFLGIIIWLGLFYLHHLYLLFKYGSYYICEYNRFVVVAEMFMVLPTVIYPLYRLWHLRKEGKL